MIRSKTVATCLAATLSFSASLVGQPSHASPARAARSAPNLAQTIDAAMSDSVSGWNEGDMKRFIALYSTAPDASFAGSKGITRGRAAMEEVYRKTYDFTDIAERGRLTIDRLDLRPLGPSHALYIGRFTLTYPGEKKPVSGLTSLVFAREKGGWKVIADHSS